MWVSNQLRSPASGNDTAYANAIKAKSLGFQSVEIPSEWEFISLKLRNQDHSLVLRFQSVEIPSEWEFYKGNAYITELSGFPIS
jgi:hypothetical protein